MNRISDPVGPESKGVYVRRRLLVLAGLLAIVAFIVLIIVKPGSTGGAATAPEVKLPAEIQAADKPEVKSTDEPVACSAGDLEVTPIIDQESYASDELPLLSLSIESKAKDPCVAELGTAAMAFKITSGSDEVWRSIDCQVEPDKRSVLLQPGQVLTTETITWDRTRSSTESCDIERDQVLAGGGTYHLHVSAAGVQGQGTARFLLY